MIVDSNVIIYSNQPGYERILDYLEASRVLAVSQITALEVLGYHKITPIDKADFELFIDSATVLPITSEVVTETIRLRQQRKRSLADSIIGATALLHNMPLLTNNVADFIDIDGLQVIPLVDVLQP